MIVVTLALIAGAPVWPMYQANPFGTKTFPGFGYYNKGDVPAVQATHTIALEGLAGDAVVGPSGDVYLVAGRHVLRVGAWSAKAPHLCTSLVMPSVASSVLALCEGTVMQLDALTGATVSEWTLATSTTNTFRPLLIDTLNGLLIVTSDTDTASFIEARSLTSGFLVWQYEGTAPTSTTPILTGDSIVLHTTDGALHLITPRYGTEVASAATSVTTQVDVQYSQSEGYVIVSGGPAPRVLAFSVTDITLAPVWSVGLSVSLPVHVLLLVPGSLEVFTNGSVVALEISTGKVSKHESLPHFGLVGGGLIDTDGTVYGAIDGMLTTFAQDGVKLCYKLLNCSGVEGLQSTPHSLLGGKSGSVTLILNDNGFVTVSTVGSEKYTQCNTREKCSCVGDLGPRSCAWCDTSGTCIEVGPSDNPVYDGCASVNMDPCNSTSPTPVPTPPPPPAPTPGTPTGLEGVWRSVPLQEGSQSQEWGYYFTSTELHLTYPDRSAAGFSTSSVGPGTVYYKAEAGTVKCSVEVLPNLPQTKQVTLACGPPGGDIPASLAVALCARKNETVQFLVGCSIPAVQHPACVFPPPSIFTATTGMCGDSCTHFNDCPQSCTCELGTNGFTCCGGGVCPTPAPTPPSPAPVPTPPPSPSDVCGKPCTGDTSCGTSAGQCPTCVNGTCGALCGGKCSASADCASASCTFCNPTGKCQSEPATCLTKCYSNVDCSTECPTCFAVSPNPGKCGANCGEKCTADEQCLGPGSCSHCTGGVCGAVPPPGEKFICTAGDKCVTNTTGYTGDVCSSVCGVLPSGTTPGGIIGKWTGVNIADGYTEGDWVFTFDAKSVTVHANALFQWSAQVMTHGPGLFFLFTEPPSLAAQNATALFALAQEGPSSPLRALDIAVGALGTPLPYDFDGPMRGFGQFVLVEAYRR